MIYSEFEGKKLSLLGFGTMRLPLLPGTGGEVDEAMVAGMVRCAAAHGVNYYDTAYPYHNSMSEIIVGRALKQLPRESYYLATKYPGHQISDRYDPAATFEEQLKKCGVDYFDFYLLHNVCENSISTYTDPRWGIMDYFLKQKQQGRIRHLGFSCHAFLDTMTSFLDQYGDVMEFCQIQLNYLDWTLQDARAKYNLLTERGIPVWVMEPVRGGGLASLDEASMARLEALRPGGSAASWAFRWLQGLPNVKMILSGMSNLEQMEENVRIFEKSAPLTEEESGVLLEIAEGMKKSVPCTACRYCCAGCPAQLDIPKLISLYNEARFSPSMNIGMAVDALEEGRRPQACIGCGQCSAACPQKIDIPAAMKEFSGILEKVPHWAELCKQREEAARRARENHSQR